MTRVIVHAGFHKTGTTSLQDFLARNRTALRPWLRYYGKADFLAAGAHARVYAQRPFPWRLWRFRRAFRTFLNGIDADDTIVLSRETFSGGMPGHRQLGGRLMMSYGRAARPLARVIVAELRRRFDPTTEIIFLYTVREREAWIKSVYGHLLRSIRITEDFKAFRAQFPDLPGPEDEARAMAAYLAPVRVVTAALEHYATEREGPAKAVLDLLDIPADVRAGLHPAPRSNPGNPPDLQAKFLEINRSDLPKSRLKFSKDRLIARAEREGPAGR
jgi:hypothetical protein